MKKITYIAAFLIILLAFSACGSSTKDTRDIEHFKSSFESAGYTLTNVDKPGFQMINASDGIIFYVDNSVVKIYQFKDDAAYKKAVKDNGFLTDLPKNGLFVAESSSEDLLEFFKTIE